MGSEYGNIDPAPNAVPIVGATAAATLCGSDIARQSKKRHKARE